VSDTCCDRRDDTEMTCAGDDAELSDEEKPRI